MKTPIMKKVTLFILLSITTFSMAQEKDMAQEKEQDVEKRHEVKINTTNFLFSEWIDVSYEYLINEETSFGVSTIIDLDSNNDFSFLFNFERKLSLTTYYRHFFSPRFARGFFVEGFGMLHSYNFREYNDYYYYDYYSSEGSYDYVSEVGFSLGISVGGKFVTKSGFTTEVYLGLGRNLGDNKPEVILRGGVSLGYRF